MAYRFTTLAGTASHVSSLDGTGRAARFSRPEGIALDAEGNLYLADTGNNVIRKITPAGVVTTPAGGPDRSGSSDGVGVEARFDQPAAVVVDAAGMVFVADRNNHTIRRIAPDGTVTTWAGAAGMAGATDGPAAVARFTRPFGLALDAAGNLYVAEAAPALRRITPGGVVSTVNLVFGDAQTGSLSARSVDSVGSDFSGNVAYGWYESRTDSAIYSTFESFGVRRLDGSSLISRRTVVNRLGQVLRYRAVGLDAAGTVHAVESSVIVRGGNSTSVAGGSAGYTNGNGAAARFASPRSLAIDRSGRLWIADTDNNAIRRVSPEGEVTTFAGVGPGDDPLVDLEGRSRFFNPAGVAVNAAGELFVADLGSATIRKISADGIVTRWRGAPFVRAVPGNLGGDRMTTPIGVSFDAQDNLWFTDFSAHAVGRFTGSSTAIIAYNRSGTPGAIDGGEESVRFRHPRGVVADASGNIYVVDQGNSTIRRKLATGSEFATLAGAAGQTGTTDGTGAAARFNLPSGATVDAAGNLYVADFGNHAIRKITPAGVVTTYAGLAGVPGAVDGPPGTARFRTPAAVVADASGNLFVADTGNRTIRHISANGRVTTIGGLAGADGGADGAGATARFDLPTGLALDRSGNLYVADFGNNTIRRGVAEPPSVLANLSVRSRLGASQTLILGLAMRGGVKSVLARAIGPTLGEFGVANTLPDPRIALYRDSTRLQENDNWGGDAALLETFSRVGAFPLAAGSLDAALVRSIEGTMTAHVTGAGAGNVLVEVYDAGQGSSPRLVNLSMRNQVGTGADILIVGFTIRGGNPLNLLIRGVGPALAAFGVGDILADPQLAVFTGSRVIASNDNWGGTAALREAFAAVGAFALPDGSRDAAIAVALEPGSYTVQLSGVGGATGVALVELYELP